MDESVADAVREAAADGIAFDGLRVECNGEVCSVEVPAEGFTQVSAAAVEKFLEQYPDYGANWYFWHETAPQPEDRWAFLRWLENAEEQPVRERYEALETGVRETWGQLAITASLDGEGGRTYEIRHVEDVGADVSTLTTHEDPLQAREIGRLDDRDRYRPLKTAPSLRTGWRLAALDAADLLGALEWFYPATIANWHREREGELDVTHWAETAERQTGIYAVIEELPDEAVDWMARATCDDSQCLKRRRWDRREDDSLDAPRGDGEFPCREPCSLVTAAARKWTTLETEEPRTFEIELTLSEANQLTEIVDAVADGRIDEIREADVNDGANRFRARYLREKLFEDDELPFEDV